jgi:hypothetical protein
MTTVADRIIIGLALTLIAWLYLRYWITGSQPADYAVILVTNHAPQRVPLQYPQLLHIQGRLGESLIEVAHGQIRFLASPCRGKQCIHTGWLTKGGDFMACLPNQVSIELQSAETAEFDAIAY